jgi:serine protease
MADNDSLPDLERRTFLKATGAAGAAAAFSGITAATPGREPGPKEDEFVLVTSAATPMQEAEASVQEAIPEESEISHRNPVLSYMTVKIPSGLTSIAEEGLRRNLERKPFVRTVERNVTFHALATPNDPRFGDQYTPQQVDAPAAWDTESGSGATVAVVDQGVKYDHPDLQAQFGSDTGRDFVDGDQDPSPDSATEEYHGTHVAGITAATRDNGEGVAGVSDATLLSGRALSEQGGGSLTDIADAVQWAADQGADIINMSLGGGGYTDTMKNAVQYALNNGALPICAAGNNGSEGVSYPAKYDECVAVGAVDDNENLANFSQYGTDLDVVAPGVDVLSTWTEPGTPYNRISGTSMACPAASGVAALGKSAKPDLSPTQLRSELKSTAVDIGLSQNRQGAGQTNAANIVAGGDGGGGGGGGDNSAPTVSVSASSATVTVGQEVTFDGSASDSDGNVTSYEWAFGDGATASGQTVSHTYSSAGDYTATLTVTDDDGATSSDSVTVTVESGGGGGTCGATSETASGDGYLYGYYDSTSFTYALSLSDPCQVTVSLDGDAYTDFDLYVTTDGRTPSTYDYDKRSITPDSQEVVVLEDVAAGQEVGILVDSYSGSGSFTVTVEETGK